VIIQLLLLFLKSVATLLCNVCAIVMVLTIKARGIMSFTDDTKKRIDKAADNVKGFAENVKDKASGTAKDIEKKTKKIKNDTEKKIKQINKK
jgi:hypothetical protein